MAPSRLSNSKVLICMLGLLLFLGSSLSAYSQVQWSCMPVQFNYEVRTMFVDSTDSTLYIGGAFRTANNQPDTAIIGIRPDGSIRRFSDPRVWPVITITKWQGKLLGGGGGGLAEYNGTAWRKIDSSGVVVTLYPYDGKLLMGGSFGSQNGSPAHALMEWDGSTVAPFKELDSITRGQGVYSITEYNGDLIIAGNLLTYPPVDPRFKDIMRWTGTSWQPLGNVGLPGGGLDEVAEMEVVGGELYVAGFFQENNGSPGNGIAKWDGSQWHRLGSGVGPGMVGVYDLEVQGDTLIVAGTFDLADGKSANEIARYWNGYWCGNDSPLPDVTVCAKDYFGTIVVSGMFLTPAGTDTCGFLAKVTSWGDCFAQAVAGVSSPPQSGPLGLQASPNPAYDRVQVEYTAAQKGVVHMNLVDVVGKTVMAYDIPSVPGANRFEVDLEGLPTGIYHLQLSNAEGHGTIKIVKQ